MRWPPNVAIAAAKSWGTGLKLGTKFTVAVTAPKRQVSKAFTIMFEH